MSQQNWKFLSPLPNGTPVDVPIATGDTLEQSLYKLQGQQNISKENIDLLQKNNKGFIIIDMNNADYVMTEEESKNGLIVVTNNDSGASVLTIYDGPNTPRDITIYSITNENYTLSLAGGNAFLTMLNVGKSKIFYIYAPGGNSIASGFTYVPYDGSNLLTPGTACKFDYNEYGLITNSYVIGKSDVGLSNVDNTSDINKPISTAVQTALDGKVPTYTGINGYTLDNNIVLTKTDIGLQYADNTSDINKPISTATQNALNNKEDKSNKGQPNGYAPLNNLGKIPSNFIDGGVSSSGIYQQFYEITAIDISNKYITLDYTPIDNNKVDIIVYGGIHQRSNVDFLVSGNQVSWDGLAMESLLEQNNYICITYSH